MRYKIRIRKLIFEIANQNKYREFVLFDLKLFNYRINETIIFMVTIFKFSFAIYWAK